MTDVLHTFSNGNCILELQLVDKAAGYRSISLTGKFTFEMFSSIQKHLTLLDNLTMSQSYGITIEIIFFFLFSVEYQILQVLNIIKVGTLIWSVPMNMWGCCYGDNVSKWNPSSSIFRACDCCNQEQNTAHQIIQTVFKESWEGKKFSHQPLSWNSV